MRIIFAVILELVFFFLLFRLLLKFYVEENYHIDYRSKKAGFRNYKSFKKAEKRRESQILKKRIQAIENEKRKDFLDFDEEEEDC